jgi:hypothetical protein
MLNFRLLDDNKNRLPTAQVIDPIVLAKHAKTLSQCFVQEIRRHFDGVLATAKIGARYPATSKRHAGEANTFVFSSLLRTNHGILWITFPDGSKNCTELVERSLLGNTTKQRYVGIFAEKVRNASIPATEYNE